MKTKIFNIFAAAMLLPLAGCDNSDDWTPGPADNDYGVKAYFVTPSTTSYVYDISDTSAEPVIEVTVCRSITDGAASIPLKLVSEVEGVTLSGNAEFAAGQDQTTVQINYGDIPLGKEATVSLEIPDDQFYTYSVGLPSVSYSVIRSTWVEIADGVTYLYQDANGDNVYPYTYGSLYQFEGSYRFKMTDFFATGLDVQFICTTGDTTGFYPLTNANYDYGKGYWPDEYEFWYFYDTTNDEWPDPWTPGNEAGYTALYFVGVYGASDYSDITMVYDPEDLYGYLSLTTYITFANNTNDFGYWYATFYLNENPFE